MPYYLGLLFGAAIGMVFIGGLAGWAVHKVLRLPFPSADALGILIVIVFAVFANSSSESGLGETAAVYTAAGMFAFFVLGRIRDKPVVLDAQQEPRLPSSPNLLLTAPAAMAPVAPPRSGALRRGFGIVLLVVFGAIGSTALFSAFKQVMSPSPFGGAPEFSFFLGALFTIPCVFIYRYMVR